MSLPHVSLDSNSNNVSNSAPSVLNYGNNQLAIISSWNRVFHALSLFGTKESNAKDAKNIQISLSRIVNYIKHHPINKKTLSREFVLVVKGLWELVEALITNKWNILVFDKEATLSIWKCLREKVIPFYNKLESMKANLAENSSSSTPSNPLPSGKIASSPTINTPVAPPSPTKSAESLVKKTLKPLNTKKSYTQASKANISSNIDDIIWVKEVFPTLLADEVGKMLNIKNRRIGTKKPKINMTTRRLSRREVIILMTKVNAELIINSAHIHISNINKCLKNSKSDIIADFIRININGIVITTNKPASNLDLSTIEKYLKNIQNVNLNSIESSHLSKSKSYMKIIGLPYSSKLGVFTPDVMEAVLKELHLFKDAVMN